MYSRRVMIIAFPMTRKYWIGSQWVLSYLIGRNSLGGALIEIAVWRHSKLNPGIKKYKFGD